MLKFQFQNALAFSRSWKMVVAAIVMQPAITGAQTTPTKILNIIPSVSCSFLSGSHSVCSPSSGANVEDTITGTVIAGPYPKGANGGFIMPSGSATFFDVRNIFTSNTTVKLRVVAQTNPNHAYSSIFYLAGGYSGSYPAYLAIGQHGSDWTFGRTVDRDQNTAYWMTPWEPVDLYPTQSGVIEDVYYTWSLNGRLRIDIFTPYMLNATTVGYTWQESIQDGGWPTVDLSRFLYGYDGGGIVYNTYQSMGSITIGGSSSSVPFTQLIFGQNDPAGAETTVPVTSQDEILGISMYSAAMTVSQMQNDVAADFPTNGSQITSYTYPCNTGRWMDLNVSTPCGSNSAAGQAVTAPPASITPVTYAPVNLAITDITSSTARYTWSAPTATGAGLTGYVLALNGNVLSHPTSTATTANVSVAPNTTYTATLIAVYPANNVATNTSFTTPAAVPGPVRNLAHATATCGTTPGVKWTWTVPASNGGSAITGYNVDINGIHTLVAATSSSYCWPHRTAASFSIYAVNAIGNGVIVNDAYTP